MTGGSSASGFAVANRTDHASQESTTVIDVQNVELQITQANAGNLAKRPFRLLDAEGLSVDPVATRLAAAAVTRQPKG